MLLQSVNAHDQKRDNFSHILLKAKSHLLAIHSHLHTRLWIEETNELDVYETEVSWNLKGLVAIAIAIAVRKKSLATAEPANQFSETPPMPRTSPRSLFAAQDSPPPHSVNKWLAFSSGRTIQWLTTYARSLTQRNKASGMEEIKKWPPPSFLCEFLGIA